MLYLDRKYYRKAELDGRVAFQLDLSLIRIKKSYQQIIHKYFLLNQIVAAIYCLQFLVSLCFFSKEVQRLTSPPCPYRQPTYPLHSAHNRHSTTSQNKRERSVISLYRSVSSVFYMAMILFLI